ncbi:hypothetical protein NUU61_007585 [Penicillium alfredii]|uniref:Vacuolar protein sorting/targeting protein 10 n=1 Tax=Penicillium alfredii TaxID=1506179 RepID=A0A9W9JYH9_9EURO|nr:uncharacterized protein NUU61_007585 [Penicillium alfredii]KAJ5086278.1 hypothetical protein NUU61_007585 [Penicillium alfredii]
MIARRLLLGVGLLLVGILQPTTADKVEVTPTLFDSPPYDLFYFEGTNTILFRDEVTLSARVSFDGGKKWEIVKGKDGSMEGAVNWIWQHPHDNHRAYALGQSGKHWITTDQAKTWRPFQVDALPMETMRTRYPLSFNGWDPRKVIFLGLDCNVLGCMPKSYYTTDDFETVIPLREFFFQCIWAASTPEFAEDVDAPKTIGDRILCVVPGLKADRSERLVYSDNFFRDDHDGTEVKLDRGRPLSGSAIWLRSVKKHLVSSLQSRGTKEEALYISDDATVWHRAEFGRRIEQDTYTLLESTNYSIQVDVQTDKRMGMLFASNSNGTYFSCNIEHTNRHPLGLVDFEKVADIQGIVIVNTVKNWEAVAQSDSEKKILVSSISFDDGRKFQPLKAGNDQLHLHSITTYASLHELSNLRRVFSSPAPGLVMGVGNTGDHLKKYTEGDLYISDDAGRTWQRARKGPHRFEFGDQGGIIVAVPDNDQTDEIYFSTNHGKDWNPVKLHHKIKPAYVTTTPDSTSLRFLLAGISNDKQMKFVINSIDFNGLHERKCGKDDLEQWTARLDENGKPDCLMGHRQSYWRRKANADCFIKKEFEITGPTFEPCKCTSEDFECDYNFVHSEDEKNCVPARPLLPPPGKCKETSDKFTGPSGWRLIPGNACIRDGGANLDGEIERSCGNLTGAPIADGQPRAGPPQYITGKETKYFYLERQASSSGRDETIFLLNDRLELHITRDHGRNWKRPAPLKDEKIMEMIPNPYYTDSAFFLTTSNKVYYTFDRGDSFYHFKAPHPRTKERLPALAFHEKNQDLLIWTGDPDCDGQTCSPEAYLSKSRGEQWEPMLRGVGECVFASHPGRNNSDQLVLCEQYEGEDKRKNRQLVSSDDWFSTPSTVIHPNIAHFTKRNEFIIVATYSSEEHKFLNASTSVDGRVFADAHFPFNVDVPQYTVLLSNGHALFLHVEVNAAEGHSFGTLVKSNSNGTYFVSSLEGLNVNDRGFADFEKMEGLEGVLVANAVVNMDDVQKKATTKKLRTLITHNDGGQWDLVPPPALDVEGKEFDCSVTKGKGTEKCALHLHGYTERRDVRDTFYSGSAIGMMIALGNVGDRLTSKDEADTFITKDGGITWKHAKKGRYMWEYGDAGSVIVLVKDLQATKVVHYTLDDGDTWKEFQFSDVDMLIDDISTVPSDTSKSFLLWGTEVKTTPQNKRVTISLDFSSVWDRQCSLDEKVNENDDYFLWTPKHPQQKDNCLFGHIEQYHRKKPEATCWNNWREPHIHSIGGNCTCTRADFECDYNYEIQSDGSCGLVPGLPKPDHKVQCTANPDLVGYWEPTGYRRIPQSTCLGGLQMDQEVSHPCPNKEEEYQKKHGISSVGLFFAIVIPIAAATAAGYYVYTRWDGKFGQIRLGESTAPSTSRLSRDSPLVAVPVAVIAGVVAVAQALPLLAMSLWRSASGYVRARSRSYQQPYSTRGSFAARRGDYTHVVDDEDELLGADDLDDDEI